MEPIEIRLSGVDHHCQRRDEGDWIVWTCDRCPGYERRYNTATHEMKISGSNAFRHGCGVRGPTVH